MTDKDNEYETPEKTLLRMNQCGRHTMDRKDMIFDIGMPDYPVKLGDIIEGKPVNQINYYLAQPIDAGDEISGGKIHAGPHSGRPDDYPMYDCKYFDEKDPLCRKRVSRNSGGISGCCIYHRYKYNELLAGEKINEDFIKNMNDRGAMLNKDKLYEWENFS